MTELLLEAKAYSEDMKYPLPITKIQAFEKRDQELMKEGYLAHPLKPHEKNTDVIRLLNRLSKRQEEAPFDNNLAKRDKVPIHEVISSIDGQRMTKTKQKRSGCF